jgi:imidazolonepropionase-like amidohydrolase
VVAEARGTGARGIKLYAALAADLLPPLVAEAHRQGLKVWAHATLLPARPHDLVSAGVDVLSHAPLIARQADTIASGYRERYRVDYAGVPADHPAMRQLIGEMLAKGTMVEPTLFVFFNRVASDAADGRQPPRIAIDSVSPQSRWAATITRELHRRGVPIIAGTDGMIGIEGDSAVGGDALPNLHEELRLLVHFGGLSPPAAIVAATGAAARAIGIDSLVGTLAPGKMADLVVLRSDPLADIANTRTIEFVVRRGKVYR